MLKTIALSGAAALLVFAGFAFAQPVSPPVFEGKSKVIQRSAPLSPLADKRARVAPETPGSVSPDNRGLISPDLWLTVLHNNDGESKYLPLSNGYAGFAPFITLLNSLKTQALTTPTGGAANGFVMISSGDNILPGATLNASLALPLSQQMFDSRAMELIGYSAITLGNHDFDGNPDVLSRFISGVSVPPSGPFVSSNLTFAGEPGLLAQAMAGRLAPWTIVNVAGRQVGIVGATTTDLPFISTPRNVIVNAVLPAVQAQVDLLTNAGIKIIIVSSHLQGLSSESALISQLRNVDAVIGGGGSEVIANASSLLVPGDTRFTGLPDANSQTNYPRQFRDADNRLVPLVTTAGDYKYIGRLVLGFDAAGNLVAIDASSGPLRVAPTSQADGVAADPTALAQVQQPVANYVAQLASTIIGFSQVPLEGRNSGLTGIRQFEQNLGNVLADSMLWAASLQAPSFNAPQPDIAIQNGGGIRNNSLIPAGNITALNTFEIAAFTNFVSIVRDVTPAELKVILETAFANANTTQSTGRFSQIAGFRVSYSLAGTRQTQNATTNAIITPGTRVRDVVLDDGTVIIRNGAPVPSARSVNIATIDFLARGGDQYPYNVLGKSFTNLGILYQNSLQSYIQVQLGGLITGADYPAGGQGRIVRLP